MLVVAPPVNEVVQEHVALCLALRLPFFVVVTKVDLGYCFPQEILSQLENIARLQGCNKNFVLQSNNNNNNNKQSSQNDGSSDVISVFAVSCVTGEGLNNLKNYIKDLSPLESTTSNSDPDSCLFQIDETFRYVKMIKFIK